MLLVLLAWGCSGADDAGQPAAAEQQVHNSGFQVSSPNFTDIRPRKRIPVKNSCFGEDISPPLNWSGAPGATKSLALIVENPDDNSQIFTHWVLYNIPPEITGLPEGVPTTTDMLPDGSIQGTNDFKRAGYAGPCPPPNYGQVNLDSGPGGRAGATIKRPHRYDFRLYALDSELELEPGATEAEVVSAMKGHILAQADTVGKYTTVLGLSFKQGAGFLKTTGAGTQTPGDGDTPNVERIYNSLGDPITPTPVVGR